MMTTENVPTRPQPVIGGETAGAAGAGGNRKNHPSSDSPAKAESLKCPRCDSTQTKFCYYNNYSLTQPRHFCKTCRRYWTRGGTLRNVPIGGGCRKNKKVRPSSNSLFSSSTPSLLSTFQDPMAEFGDLKSEGIGGIINFFHGSTTTTNPPGVDFQLGGGLSFPSSYQSTPISINPLTPTLYPQISSFADISTNRCRYGLDLTAGIGGGSGTSTSFLGSPVASAAGLKPTGETSGAYGLSSSIMDMGSSNLLTSIDSLSPTNQELQWKLQQQRLAVLYGQRQEELEEENREDEGSLGNNHRHGMQKPQPILFQNLEISSKGNDHHRRHQGIGCGFGIRSAAAVKEENAAVTSTEWFFENPRISNGAAPRSNHGGSSSNNDSGITNFVQAWNYGNHHH